MIDIYMGLGLALLTCLRRGFYKGPNLYCVSVINFALIFLIYYLAVNFPVLKSSNIYIIGIFRGAIISSLILTFSNKDRENHILWICFLFLTFLTMLLDYFKYTDSINNNLYIILGRTSTIIELILINIKFNYAKRTGFLNNISGGHPFFINIWSFKSIFIKTINSITIFGFSPCDFLCVKNISTITKSKKITKRIVEKGIRK